MYLLWIWWRSCGQAHLLGRDSGMLGVFNLPRVAANYFLFILVFFYDIMDHLQPTLKFSVAVVATNSLYGLHPAYKSILQIRYASQVNRVIRKNHHMFTVTPSYVKCDPSHVNFIFQKKKSLITKQLLLQTKKKG